VRGGHGDALAEHRSGVGDDAVEQAVVDANENTHGGAGVGFEQRDEFGGTEIEDLGVLFEAAKQGDVIGYGK